MPEDEVHEEEVEAPPVEEVEEAPEAPDPVEEPEATPAAEEAAPQAAEEAAPDPVEEYDAQLTELVKSGRITPYRRREIEKGIRTGRAIDTLLGLLDAQPPNSARPKRGVQATMNASPTSWIEKTYGDDIKRR